MADESFRRYNEAAAKRDWSYLSKDELEALFYAFKDDKFGNIANELRDTLNFTNAEILKFVKFLLTGKYQKIKYREIDHLF